MLPPSFLDPPPQFPLGPLQSQHQGDNSALCVRKSVGHNGIHRRQNEAAIVGSVISALQPTIAEAVAAALAATSTRPSSSSSGSSASSGFIPARDSNATPAKYNYIYKVADDGTQTYISQEEQRDVSHTIISASSRATSSSLQGLEVQGTYSYVDPTGAIVTVNYNVSADDDDDVQ